jgi:multiple sugar transport system permease protein
MILLYYDLRGFGLIGSYWAMILPAIALGLPAELAEAARIDGCIEFDVFSRVILPLAQPVISTLVVFQFIRNHHAQRICCYCSQTH